MATMREGFEALEKFDVDVKFVGAAGPGRRYCYWDVHMDRGYWITRSDIMAAAGVTKDPEGFSEWCNSGSVRQMSERAVKRVFGFQRD